MSLYRHRDQQDPANQRRRDGVLLCSNFRCGSNYYIDGTLARPAIEVVVNTRGSFTNDVLTPCVMCRRSFRQQQGRRAYEYTGLTFTGIDPQTPNLDFSSALTAVQEQNRLAREAAAAEYQRIIDSRREGEINTFLTSTSLHHGPTLGSPNDYGLRHVRVGPYSLTPGQAEAYARQMMALATEARESAQSLQQADSLVGMAGAIARLQISTSGA